MTALAYTVAFEGIEARMVEVQCAVAPGIPAFSIVGLPDKAVSEARERVRSALSSMAIALPSKRITINLSPADLPKIGSHFDLPIALGLLAAEAVAQAVAERGQFQFGKGVQKAGRQTTKSAVAERGIGLARCQGRRRGGRGEL